MGVNRYWQGAALIVIKSELIVAGRALGVGQEQNRSPVRAGGKLSEEQLPRCRCGIERYHREGGEFSNGASGLNRGRGHTLFQPG